VAGLRRGAEEVRQRRKAHARGAAGGMAVGNAAGGFTFLGGMGLGFIANGVLRLPGWARTRRRQMDALAAEIALPRPAAAAAAAATIAGR
jgi:hypothetical protein